MPELSERLSAFDAAWAVASMIDTDLLPPLVLPVDTDEPVKEGADRLYAWLTRAWTKESLSTGEKVLVGVARCLFASGNCADPPALGDLLLLDADNRAAVLDTITRCWGW